jgi:hypothetical protein
MVVERGQWLQIDADPSTYTYVSLLRSLVPAACCPCCCCIERVGGRAGCDIDAGQLQYHSAA